MKARRLYKPRPAGTLKAAMAELVEACGGTLRAADLLGVSQSQIQRCTDAVEAKAELKLSWVRALERDCRRPIVTSFLALEAGHAIIPIDIGSNAPLAADMARFGEHAAELFGRYATALADGALSATEAGQIKNDVLHVMGALAAMLPDLDLAMSE